MSKMTDEQVWLQLYLSENSLYKTRKDMSAFERIGDCAICADKALSKFRDRFPIKEEDKSKQTEALYNIDDIDIEWFDREFSSQGVFGYYFLIVQRTKNGDWRWNIKIHKSGSLVATGVGCADMNKAKMLAENALKEVIKFDLKD